MCFGYSSCLLFIVLFLDIVFLLLVLILFFVLVVGALFFVLVFLMYCGFLLVSFDVPDLVFVLKNGMENKEHEHGRTRTILIYQITQGITTQQRQNQARIKNLELRTHSVTKNIQQHTDKTTRTTLNEFGLLLVSFILFCFLKLCFGVLIILVVFAVGAMSFATVHCFYCWGFLAFVFPDLGFVLENQMEQRTRIWNK